MMPRFSRRAATKISTISPIFVFHAEDAHATEDFAPPVATPLSSRRFLIIYYATG